MVLLLFLLIYIKFNNICLNQKAILCAPFPDESQTSESNELSIGFANRSAVFFHLKQYDNCLEDISNALKYNYPLNRMKLWLRKANCLIENECYNEAKETLNYADINGDNDSDNGIKIKNLFQLINEKEIKNLSKNINRSDSNSSKARPSVVFESNSQIPNASSKLELCNSESKGRYIRAKQDIKECDVLFMERPFASVLLPQFYKTRCHHCYKKLLNTTVMPCLKCTQIRYCSDDCVNQSWNRYHSHECGNLDLMKDIGIAHLALRILLVSGIDEAIKVSTSNSSELPYLNNYSSVYGLVDHSNDFPLEDILNYTLVASLLLLLCKKLGLVETETQNYDIIGGILLKHILQLITNGHAISSMENIAQSSGLEFEDIRIATAIYPTVSLMNHSCDPNVIAIYDKDLLIIRANRNIANGEEVMNCYGPHCKRMSKSERQTALLEQYFFKCECKSCSNETKDLSRALLCHDCRNAIFFDEQMEDNGFCLGCQRNDFNIKSILNEVYKGMNVLSDGSKMIDENKLLDGEQELLKSHLILQSVLYPKNRNFGKIKDELSRCYARMNDWTNAVKYCRESVDIVREVFGESSIEMSNELIKLSDLEFELLDSTERSADVEVMAQKCLITTSRAIKLLTNYTIPTDESCEQMNEIKRLEERLVFCDLLIKQLTKN